MGFQYPFNTSTSFSIVPTVLNESFLQGQVKGLAVNVTDLSGLNYSFVVNAIAGLKSEDFELS